MAFDPAPPPDPAGGYVPPSTRTGTIVVTGAAAGVGRGIAEVAARRGMTVVVTDIDAEGIDTVVQRIRDAGGRAVGHVADVTDHARVAELAARVTDEFGGTDILVNNAGIEHHGLLWEVDVQHWTTLVDINVNGVFHGVRQFVPLMIERGEPAHVVNVSSTGGLGARGLMSPYITSKHAIMGMTESLDLEFRSHAPFLGASLFIPSAVKSQIFLSAGVSGDSKLGTRQREAMQRRNLADGMDPDDAAELLFRGIDAGRLWIHTHPEVSEKRIRERTHALLTNTPVSPPAEPG